MGNPRPRLVAVESVSDEQSRVVKAELNLERFTSLFVPSQSRGRRREIRTLQDIQTLPNGDIITNTVEIEPSMKLGTLTAKDQRVLYALFLNWKEKGSPLGYCYYSTYRLAQILKANTSGASIDSILDSLRRLNAVTLRFKHCFHDAEAKTNYKDEEPIHILSELKIRIREREKDGKYKPMNSEGYVAFHSRILKNLIRQYTRPVLFDVVLSLSSDVAQFVYSIVDRQLSTKADFNITTKNLFDELSIEGKDYRYTSARMRVLKAPLAELEGKPLSSGGFLRITERETKDKKDLVLIFSKRAKAITAPKPKPEPSQSEQSELVKRMVEELGISESVAQTLEVSNAKACLDWCEAKRYSKELSGKGAGFFVKAILEGWQLPTDFKATKERAKKKAGSELSKQREQAREAHRQKCWTEFLPFALSQLDTIQEQHQEAFTKFDESLSDQLKSFDQFGFSETRKREATIFHAEWFFNDAYWQTFQIPFVTFWEWDAKHNPQPFQESP